MTRALPGGIDCMAAIARVWDYLDGELDATRLAALEAHLAECRDCPPHFAFADRLLGHIAAARATAQDEAALQSRVVAALRAEGFGSTR